MNRSPLAVLALLAALAALAASGCGSGSGEAEPPEIAYGQDVCDQCGMLISEERFAAGYVTAAGEARRFDDVGDLLAYRAAHDEEVEAFWVHDYDSRAWLRAEDAWFLSAAGITTPMASGLVAFATEERARELAGTDGGQAMPWEELLTRFAAGEVGPKGMGEMEMGEGDTGSMP